MENYSVVSQIGEGTYGKVYKAVNIKTNEVVAIKTLNVIDKEEGVSYSALQEVKYLRQLSECSRVMKLLDVFIDQNSTVMVFNYADADLTGILSRSSSSSSFKLSIRQAKSLFKQLLEGMVQLHSRGLIHRDIKAANLLIHKGNLFLGDFGMTTNFKNHTVLSPNVVTLWYRAPELLLGSTSYGPEIDMWSCGCILIELLTYQNPFPGISDQHQMDLIFKIIGTPDVSTWGSSLEKLAGYKNMRKGLYKATLQTVFKDWDPEALDLLEKLLAPPHLRITAEKALEHSFFKAEPLPCSPDEMGVMPTVHEYEVKKRKMEQFNNRQQSRGQSQYQDNQTSDNNNSRPSQGRGFYPHSHTSHPLKQPYHSGQPSHQGRLPQFDNTNFSNNPYSNNNPHNTNNNININTNNTNNNDTRKPRVFISRDRQNPNQQNFRNRTSTPTLNNNSTSVPRPTSSQQISPQTSPQHTPNARTSPPTSSSGYTRTVPKPTMRISSSRDRSGISTSQRATFTEEPAIKKQRTFTSSKSILSSNTTAMKGNHHSSLATPIVITSITDEQKLPPSSTTVSSC